MPTRNDLSEALPQLIDAESRLHDYANNVLGIDYRIADFGAVRTDADTALIMQYRQDDYDAAVRANPNVANTPINEWRPIAPYGSSYHNYGAAFDVLITDRGGFESDAAALSALKVNASRFGLRSSVPNDPPHFELPVPLETARQMWIDYTGDTDVPPVPPSGTGNIAAVTTLAAVGALIFLLRHFRK